VRGFFRSLGWPAEVAEVAAGLVTEPPRRVVTGEAGRTVHVAAGPRALPQGSPCSPAIANALLAGLDSALVQIARQHGARYTRYADDLCFSLQSPEIARRLRTRVEAAIAEAGFDVNEKKSAVLRAGGRQAITGLVLNPVPGKELQAPRVPREVRRRIRAALHAHETGRTPVDSLETAQGLAAYVYASDRVEGARLLARVRAIREGDLEAARALRRRTRGNSRSKPPPSSASADAAGAASPAKWLVLQRGRTIGPIALADLLSRLRRGRLDDECLIREADAEEWSKPDALVARTTMSGPARRGLPPAWPADRPDSRPRDVRLVRIHRGQFSRGYSVPVEDQAKESHRGRRYFEFVISRPFEIWTTPVTRAQHAETLGLAAPAPGEGTLPVTGLSWFDAILYCNALSRRHGLPEAYVVHGDPGAGEGLVDWLGPDHPGWRLPTDAEWELAARAGGRPPTDSRLSRMAWHSGTSEGGPHPVASRHANAWGIFDLHGNVGEWVWDFEGELEAEGLGKAPRPRYRIDVWGRKVQIGAKVKLGYAHNRSRAPVFDNETVFDPVGPPVGQRRSVRGGSFRTPLAGVRCAAQRFEFPSARLDDVGLRPVRTAVLRAPPAAPPSTDPSVLVVRADGRGDARSLAHALAIAPDGARILLEAGRHRGGVTIRRDVTIEGNEGATIASVDRPALVIAGGKAVIRGVKLHQRPSTGVPPGLEGPTVRVEEGSATFENCAFNPAPGVALQASGPRSGVRVVSCDFRPAAQHAIVLDDGALVELVDFKVEPGNGRAVRVGPRATLRAHASKDGRPGSGSLFGVDFAPGAHAVLAGVRLGSESTIEDDATLVLRDGSADALLVRGSGRVELEASWLIAADVRDGGTILAKGGGMARLTLEREGAAQFEGVAVRGGPIIGGRLSIGAGSRAVFNGCRIGDEPSIYNRSHKDQGVRISDDAVPVFDRCRFDGLMAQIEIVEAARPKFVSSSVTKAKDVGTSPPLRCRGTSAPLLEDCSARSADTAVMELLDGSRPTVRRTALTGQGDEIVRAADHSEGIFEECALTDAAHTAFVVTGAARPTCLRVTFSKCAMAAVRLEAGTEAHFEACAFEESLLGVNLEPGSRGRIVGGAPTGIRAAAIYGESDTTFDGEEWVPALQARSARQARSGRGVRPGVSGVPDAPPIARVPPGMFVSPSAAASKGAPPRVVALTYVLEAWTRPVTQEQYRALLDVPAWRGFDPKARAVRVRWRAAARFANRVSELEGLPAAFEIDESGARWLGLAVEGWRLPTEAEWEYLALGGAVMRADWRPPPSPEAPNGWGLFDIPGAHEERCVDVEGRRAGEESPPTMLVDPVGPEAGVHSRFTRRVVRGGPRDPLTCRGTAMDGGDNKHLGFRLVRTVPKERR
jgi:formylglycine-generating enzyme required for sulfatase activity